MQARWILYWIAALCLHRGKSTAIFRVLATASTGRTSSAMCDGEEMQVKLEAIWDHRVEMRLSLRLGRLLRSPAPETCDAIDVCVDCEAFLL